MSQPTLQQYGYSAIYKSKNANFIVFEYCLVAFIIYEAPRQLSWKAWKVWREKYASPI